MTTTIRFYLDGQLVGTQTADLTPSQQQPITVSQQATLGGVTGTLSVIFDVTDGSYSDPGTSENDIYIIDWTKFKGATIYSISDAWRFHYVEKEWSYGELTRDNEGWELYEPWSPYMHSSNYDSDGDLFSEYLYYVDEIEVHLLSVQARFYEDDTLEDLIETKLIFTDRAFALPAAPARPSPLIAFAGWMAFGGEDTDDDGADTATPWPWNPGDEIEYDWEENVIKSDPDDTRGGCRRKNIIPQGAWYPPYDHLSIDFYACWHTCTGKLIRDGAGHLMRDDTTGRPLIDL